MWHRLAYWWWNSPLPSIQFSNIGPVHCFRVYAFAPRFNRCILDLR